ncbi:MAG: FG-GAP repeat domain-containing protein [Candidatus Hodarchaeales archaeon]|jgi:hypothetical protein
MYFYSIAIILLITGFSSPSQIEKDNFKAESSPIFAKQNLKIDALSYTTDHDLNTAFSFPFNLNITARGVVAGNLHPDGELRLMYGSHQGTNGSVASFFNRTTFPYGFTFEGIYNYSVGLGDFYDYLEPILAYDFDNDGIDEVLCDINYEPVIIGWNGTGYYPKWPNITDIIKMDDGAQIYSVDGDSYPELITNTRENTHIYSWDGNMSNFQLDETLDGGAWFNVGIGDITNDGVPDIVTSDYADEEVHVYSFQETEYIEEFVGNFESNGYSAFTIVDINNDRINEMFGGSPNAAASEYAITMFQWSGTELHAQNLTTNDRAFFDFISGDIDGDSFDEVITIENGGNIFIIEEDNNVGTLNITETTLQGSYYLKLFDIDQNNFPEIVSVNVYYDNISNDDLPPRFKYGNPAYYSFIIGEEPRIIDWVVVDADPDRYEKYINGSLEGVSPLISGSPVLFHTSELNGSEPSLHNVTYLFWDQNNNYDFATIIIEYLPDIYSPQITGDVDHTHEDGDDLYTVKWNVFDLNPGYYYIFLDGQENSSGFWINGDIVYNASDPDLGDYNITLFLTDGYNNFNTFTSWLHIVDTTAPTLVPHPDLNITSGATGKVLKWDVFDLNPADYELRLDGEHKWIESWRNINTIEVSLDLGSLDLTALGFHEIDIFVWDTSGNEVSDTVIVYVYEEGEEPTTTEPTDTSTEPTDTDTTSQVTLTTTSGFGFIFLLPITICLALIVMNRRRK